MQKNSNDKLTQNLKTIQKHGIFNYSERKGGEYGGIEIERYGIIESRGGETSPESDRSTKLKNKEDAY